MGEKTSTGIEENIAGLLCYLLGFVTGIIFYLIEKENKTVRFHAVQSIVVFGAIFVLNIVVSTVLVALPVIGWIFVGLISTLISLAALVLWVLLMFKAYKGEKYKLPIAGDLAEKYAQ